jgi:signal peptidase II
MKMYMVMESVVIMLKRLLGICLIAGAIYCDLYTKNHVFQTSVFAQKTPVLFFLYWLPVYNTGIAWSIAASQGSLVIWGSVMLSIACSVEFLRYPSSTWGLICSGGLANTYDRLVFGAVRDFIALSYGGYTFPIFNLADCYLSLGIFLLLIQHYIRNSHSHTLLGDR